MQGRNEVEEILEQQLWADRNGVIRGAALPPAQMLRDHELKTYRDCPMEYEVTPSRLWQDLKGFALFAMAVFVLGGLGDMLVAWLKQL